MRKLNQEDANKIKDEGHESLAWWRRLELRLSPCYHHRGSQVVRANGTSLSTVTARQTGMHHTMRSILVDWMWEVCWEFDIGWESGLQAVQYLDRFLLCPVAEVVDGTKVQAIGAACILLAAKLHEVSPPTLGELASVCAGAYTSPELADLEMLVLKRLDFRLHSPTLFPFLEAVLSSSSLMSSAAATATTRLRPLCRLLAQIAVSHSIEVNQFLPSLVATSIVRLASRMLGIGDEPNTMDWVQGQQELRPCVEWICAAHLAYVTRFRNNAQTPASSFSLTMSANGEASGLIDAIAPWSGADLAVHWPTLLSPKRKRDHHPSARPSKGRRPNPATQQRHAPSSHISDNDDEDRARDHLATSCVST